LAGRNALAGATTAADAATSLPSKAVPYGIYDIAGNAGWVNLGIRHDTAMFSVENIRRWWY